MINNIDINLSINFFNWFLNIGETDNWQDFKISRFFEIRPTKYHRLTNSSLMEKDGLNPVIVNSSYNNGIGGYTNQPITEGRGIITFSDTTSSEAIFYQDKPFVGYSHVQGMYPIGEYKDNWTKNSLLFFLSVFKKRASDLNYDYVNKFTRESAQDIMIKLPIDSNGNPDWLYMDLYIAQLKTTTGCYLQKLEYINHSTIKNINTTEWKDFHLYDIFNIDSGTKLDKAKMDTTVEIINFVGRSNFNNGITQKVNIISNITPYESGNLTLALGGAYLGSCFIQQEPFYTSQNVVVLLPKTNISFESKQFIATAIFKESQNNYRAFIKELNRHVKTDFKIKLPIDKQGNPDYDYMGKYIKSIRQNAELVIDKLNFIV